MDCKYTSFDKVIHSTKELPDCAKEEAVEIIKDGSFAMFLGFCVENGCFTQKQSEVVYCFIAMWEDLDGNYWEEDREKLLRLYDKVGITEEMLK